MYKKLLFCLKTAFAHLENFLLKPEKKPSLSLKPSSLESSSKSSFCFFERLAGVLTIALTYKSPILEEFISFTPRPLSLNIVSVCVPAGTLSIAFFPEIVGTSSSLPSAASAKLIGISKNKSLAPLLKILWGFTSTTTYKSPCIPPFKPVFPSPLSLKWFPESMPAGIFTLILFLTRIWPEPLHFLQGFFIAIPEPWHFGQVVRVENIPNTVLCVLSTIPLPLHALHFESSLSLLPV